MAMGLMVIHQITRMVVDDELVDFHSTLDLAVGAPFENDGVVYIFRGGRSGLSTTPSQRIYAPKMDLTVPAMFGFSISKGCDVDDNNFPGFRMFLCSIKLQLKLKL